MSANDRLKHLARNLALLSRSYGSVAEVCRRIGINRQQFNKYLAGHHMPSGRVLARLAQFFLIEEEQIFAPPAIFDAIFEGPRFDFSWIMRSSTVFQRFVPFVVRASEAISPYYGVYFRYHRSSIYRGRVLRSIVYLFEKDGIPQYVCIERFQELDGTGRIDCLFKYYGIAVMVDNRIFFADFENVQRNEITYSIILPKYRNVLRTLYGITTGIAATPLREPFSTRVALDFQGPGPVRRQHLRMGSTLLPNDPSIPSEVRAYLSEPTDPFIRSGIG